MIVILPFEKDFYARYDYEADFVGHPLLDMIEELPANNEKEFRQKNRLQDKPIIALLPGSRKQEIRKMLPLMLSVVPHFTEYQFVVAGAPSVESEFYTGLMGNYKVQLITGQTHRLLQNAYSALVTSGTATLETALFNVPEVVCYKGGFISYQIAKRVIDKSFIKYISLVNLIMDKEVVKELIQNKLTAANLKVALESINSDQNCREQILADYSILKEKLGGPGASAKTAELINKIILT